MPPCTGCDGVAQSADRVQLRPDQQQAQRHHDEGHDAKNRVDATAQVGQVAFVDFRLCGQPRRIAVLTDRIHVYQRHAGNRRRPRVDGFAFLFAHGPGFTGKHGLVKFQPPGMQDCRISRHLLPRPDPHQISEHNLRRRNLDIVAVAAHQHRRSHQNRQTVERDLRPQFSDDADGGVDDDDQPEHRVFP